MNKRGVECKWDKISSLTKLADLSQQQSQIQTSKQDHSETMGITRLKQLTIYPLAYRAKWMDEKDGCHTVWLAKEFKWLADKKKFNRWDVINISMVPRNAKES